MKKRYTIAFEPTLSDLAGALQKVAETGAEIQSTQLFIGTAIVVADPTQMENIRGLAVVKSVSETGVYEAS